MQVLRETICGLVGCAREARNGYDHCARCGTSYWRVAGNHGVPAPFQTGLDPLAGVRDLAAGALASFTASLTVLDEMEGSELFTEEPAYMAADPAMPDDDTLQRARVDA